MTLEEKAMLFATQKHSEINQRRKYTNEPYINHPKAVVEIVKSVPHSEAMVAAAWLHDTVEDTETTLEEIAKEFGMEVALLVKFVTDVSKPEDGNRAFRKKLDRQHVANGSPESKTIKLADLIDNSHSIIERDPKFAKVYLDEKRLLLKVLKDGDRTLWDRANSIVQDAI